MLTHGRLNAIGHFPNWPRAPLTSQMNLSKSAPGRDSTTIGCAESKPPERLGAAKRRHFYPRNSHLTIV
jgi:hypothetical protein